MKKLGIVTQSYKADFKECGLLCQSIDAFVPDNILHYIFVNDEDYELFLVYNYGQHIIYKKSSIIPKWLISLPFKIAGHYFHVSPFTYPVREWIIQQICKLGAFEVVSPDIDCLLNIDSETVFVRPFDYSLIVHEEKFLMFREPIHDQPSHNEYCFAAKKLLKLRDDVSKYSEFDYMNVPVCFERDNTILLLQTIAKNNIFNSWKISLCNTYRFSEYYLYGIYTDKILNLRSHFLIDKHLFPQIDISEYNTIESFKDKAKELYADSDTLGFWLQKKNRKKLGYSYLSFEHIVQELRSLWNQKVQ